jgi:AcrR family transcriptional regulator
MSDLKSKILTAALAIAARVGIAATSRNAIAAKADCSTGSVSFHFGAGRQLQKAIVEAAIEREDMAVLGFAVAERHPTALRASDDLRARAIRHHLRP